MSLDDIAKTVGLSPDEVEAELTRLHHDGLVDAEVHRSLNGGNAGGWFVIEPRLTGAGARRLGEWPDGTQFLALIENMASEERDPEKRSRLKGLAGSVREVGVSVVSEVLVALLKAQGHMG